ncbi:MAG: 6-phosphogluconolactonase [Xanthomonadaceae bacterium]|nr:6-phosphogluconolactonase [Xanthomonadaceae bacterium]MDE2178255.1 6-phosphogluconolactonase [Xanthomonadaceae bacterium]
MPDSVPPPALRWHTRATLTALAPVLADAVAGTLRHALARRDRATLALSGGTTPGPFLAALATHALDWPRLIVTLADERWVPAGHPRANATLVRDILMKRAAPGAARFVPLYAAAATPEDGLAAVRAGIDALPLPLDAVVLGMGDDGHIASLFPGGDHLAAALDPHASARVLPMRAPAAAEPRMTLTLPLLAGARSVFLLITGATKRAVLERGVDDVRLPVHALLAQARTPIAVYWAP